MEPCDPPASRRARLAVLVGFLLLHGLLAWLASGAAPRLPFGDERMYLARAVKLRAGGTVDADPRWPPLYPAFLAVLGATGAGPGPLAVLVQVGLLLGAGLLLRDLAERGTGSAVVADLAAALFLLDPQLAAFAHYAWPEVLHLALLLGLVRCLGPAGPPVPAAAAAGLLAGLALLTKSVLGPFLPVLAWALARAPGPARGLAPAAAFVLVSALVVAPVMVENGRRHGVFVVADSFALNLWIGLRDASLPSWKADSATEAMVEFQGSGSDFPARQAATWARIRAHLEGRGPLAILRAQLPRQYFRLFDRRSFLDEQLPGGAVAAGGRGYRDPPPWAAHLLQAWEGAVWLVLAVASAWGGALLLARAAPWMWILVDWVVFHLALFLFVHAKSRYRIPLLPVLDLAAAAALARALGRFPGPGPGPVARGAAALAGAAFLFFAFCGGFFEGGP